MAVDRIKYIKEKYTCVEMAQLLGLAIKKSGDRCASLAPNSHNPTAMIVYDDWWYDFKQGCGGDVIDLYAEVKFGGDKGKAIFELSGDLNSKEWLSYTKALNGKIQKCHNSLRDSDIKYLHKRKINSATIKRLKLGYDEHEDRLIIPYFKNGYVAYYVARDRSGKEDAAKYKKAALDGFNENIPWGLHSFDNKHRDSMKALIKQVKPDADLSILDDYAVIAEGAFDAMSFEQEGFRVLSSISGYFNKEAKKQVAAMLKTVKSVFVCFDNDMAGTRFTTDMCEFLFENRIQFNCGVLPEKYKDISEYYADGGDLFQLVKDAKPGIPMLAGRITDKKEFKAFLKKAARFVEKSDLVELCENITAFQPKWVAAVLEDALRIPAEPVFIEEIQAKYKLKYIENMGFYEYRHGVWLPRSDNAIGGYFLNLLGHWATNARASALTGYLQKELSSEERFNLLPVFNFRNGILELETGNFREHSEADMSSIQVEYDYDEAAKCPKWLKFIGEVMNNRIASIMLIQEMMGYILYNDCMLQRCFFMIGDGANGKSVLLNLIRAVFSEPNVSNVEMSSLIDQFQRINLANSLVNISTETASSVKGAESLFKQIVAGDEITGCYKNKDYVKFKPRCVMISACNEYIKAKDDTAGFLRRICFIDFPCKFEGAKADRQLEKKLKTELPGIFNWAYEGYKRLKQQGRFTETPEQVDMLDDFRKSINPLAAFIEEELAGQEDSLTRKQLYNKYVEWAKEAGHEALSRTNFIRKFKMTIKQVMPHVTEKKIHGERYFNFPHKFLTAQDFENLDDEEADKAAD
ncbi:MAG: toprim domain-containing protein [Synergistaceae bacterium]|nr:toprim domain-containing protein [Synergistaceae bacterium]